MTGQEPKARVLVVDDDDMLLTLLVDTLTAIGYQAVPASGGVEALRHLGEERFDLMITDIKMPDIDGLQLFKKVRRHYADMPVLFITGMATAEIVDSTSADGFLAKPFRISHIEELIENALKKTGAALPSRMRKVLILEKDEVLRETLAGALSNSHCIPFSSSSADDAVRELESGRFDVIITEHNPDGLSLDDLLTTIRAGHGQTPVIVLSDSGSSEETVPDRHRDRVQGQLRKPFKSGQVIEMLNRLSPVSSNDN